MTLGTPAGCFRVLALLFLNRPISASQCFPIPGGKVRNPKQKGYLFRRFQLSKGRGGESLDLNGHHGRHAARPLGGRKIPQYCVCPRNQTVYSLQVKTLKDWKPEFPGLSPVTKENEKERAIRCHELFCGWGCLPSLVPQMDRRNSVMGASSYPACLCFFPSLLAMLVLQVLLWKQFEGKVQAGRQETHSEWLGSQTAHKCIHFAVSPCPH